jgi:hypothetical protein
MSDLTEIDTWIDQHILDILWWKDATPSELAGEIGGIPVPLATGSLGAMRLSHQCVSARLRALEASKRVERAPVAGHWRSLTAPAEPQAQPAKPARKPAKGHRKAQPATGEEA